MVVINFQNKFSGRELADIILESAKESNLDIDFNKDIDSQLKSKSRHIHLSRQIQNPTAIYDWIKKSISIPKISCCFYLFDKIYTNKYEFEIYLGLVKEFKKGIRESDKDFMKIYPVINSYLGGFISGMKQKLNSAQDMELSPFPDKFAEIVSDIYKECN